MSKDHADLIARADHFVGLIGYGNRIDQEFARRMVCDLRDALVLSEGALIFAKRALAEANARCCVKMAVHEGWCGGTHAVDSEGNVECLSQMSGGWLAHQPLEGSNKGLVDSTTSLAARGSNEAAPSWLKKEIARTDALIAAIPGGAKGVEEARARAVEENREELEQLRLLREQTPGLIARAERILRGEYIVSEDGYPEGGEADMRLIRDLRDALAEANAKIARVTDAVDDVLADANEATNPVRRGGMRAAVVEIQIALADEAEAERCDNPLRSEITCAMLVRDNDHLRKRAAGLEAQRSSLREKIEALRDEAEKNPLAQAGSFLHGQETAFGIVLALLEKS
jgi:hypothetical protein